MQNIVPFSFDSRQIRTITDEHGEPWFVASDVCAGLDIDNTSQALSRLDDDERGIISNDTPGGSQRLLTINESGLFSLILGSRKPEAKRFKRWVTSEVLPAIRKTGHYQVKALTTLTPSQIGRQLIEDMLSIAALTDIPKSYALQVAGSEAARQTDMPWDRLLTGSAHMSNLPADDVMLEPSELGALFDLTPADMNKRLEWLGLQCKEGGEWVPTAAGAEHCVRHAWTTKNKSGYNLKWRAVAIERIIAALD